MPQTTHGNGVAYVAHGERERGARFAGTLHGEALSGAIGPRGRVRRADRPSARPCAPACRQRTVRRRRCEIGRRSSRAPRRPASPRARLTYVWAARSIIPGVRNLCPTMRGESARPRPVGSGDARSGVVQRYRRIRAGDLPVATADLARALIGARSSVTARTAVPRGGSSKRKRTSSTIRPRTLTADRANAMRRCSLLRFTRTYIRSTALRFA